MAKIKTTVPVIPQIYAYTTPEIARHNGWTKIGYTEQEVKERIGQQTHTADVGYKLEWQSNATYEDGSGYFTDKAFHAYLERIGIHHQKGTEWFEIKPTPARHELYEFRDNKGLIQSTAAISYKLREEQNRAVSMAVDYFKLRKNGEFLWNAKPRFGKTLATYDLCKRMNAKNVLVVTNRPAIANSWYEDYCKFLSTESGYLFVSSVDTLDASNGTHQLVYSSEAFNEFNKDNNYKRIEFMSLQNLKGSKYFGGEYDKLHYVTEVDWDLLVIDEAHEGVDTLKTDVAFDHIKRKNTLHLSGTPFKALANDKFEQRAIFNWTYADEQKAKENWHSDYMDPNPYATLPKLNMYTYKMSDIVYDQVAAGTQIDGETVEYAFDLNEFFKTDDKTHRFIHDAAVNKFLDALVTQSRFPFSTKELRDELKHTLWILNRVDSCKALAKKLANHDIFKEYKVVLAAGDGKMSEDEETKKAYDQVVNAIARNDKTITLSVGQLTTGVTIPEWTAVFMLGSTKSPAQYMQAAFRAQNPCLFHSKKSKKAYRKTDAYVFDFDPARTLILFEQFANDLNTDTADGRGTVDEREEHVKELLNFFPVYGEDENGEMILLDAAQVLSIPRKIKSTEVVDRGFMSNFLFQNISNVFGAPASVLEIIKKMEPAKEPKESLTDTPSKEELYLDDDGEIHIPDDKIEGTAAGIFGDKIYGEIGDDLGDIIDRAKEEYEDENKKDEDDLFSKLEAAFNDGVTQPLLDKAEESYGKTLKKSTKARLEKHINASASAYFKKERENLNIEKNNLEHEREQELDKAKSDSETKAIHKEYNERKKKLQDDFSKKVEEGTKKLAKKMGKKIVESVETDKCRDKQRAIEEGIRDHLRGFSRTIPSFLMAYGNEDVHLSNFDKIVPPPVFQDVTSISLDDFILLRDGGELLNPETKQKEHFNGRLFDPIVFDDSVAEFMNRKRQLANYFEEGNDKDIFDYIPPQKTNQIFTPKRTVQDMVDRLEAENPGCFDNPDKTFIDLYMKSGMYITEIVKRLYKSEHMKELFPDGKERLNHIFKKQVFGLAPTEIIYNIALSYILGFSETVNIKEHNIRLLDALPFAENGTLEDKLIELFGSVLQEDE